MSKFLKIIIGFTISFSVIGIYLTTLSNGNNLKNIEKEQIVPWGIKRINASVFWSKDITGKNVNIAIMDSGINYSHPDFVGKIKKGFNAINSNQDSNDDYGHGTLVTGVIFAQHNNFGIVGIAPDANIYPVKVLNNAGEGDISNIVRGIEWCIFHNIDIINMSFAITSDKLELRKAIQKALDANIIIVASGMNSFGNDVGFPAKYPGVISVTSIDKKYRLSETSPRGKIDFSAPGVDILSTSNENGYKIFSGTSLAAPHITGIIALLLQNDPNLKREIYTELTKYLKDLGSKGKDNLFGEGILILKNN